VSKPAHAGAAAPGQAGRRLGIIGAGRAGIAIARAAVEAGYDVAIAGSGPASRAALTVEVFAPGARAASTGEVIRHAGVIILAVPAHRFRELPRGLLAGKIVVDAMNYWEPVDGTDAGLAAAPAGTSRIVQDWFPAARVVKSLNQLGYHDFEDSRREHGAPDRVAMAAAGDDPEAVRVVMQLIDRLGFDPVDAGALDNGTALEPGGPAFGAAYTSDALSGLLASPGQEEAAMPEQATARLRRYHASSLVRHRGSRLPARRCARPGAPATDPVRRRPGSWFPAAGSIIFQTRPGERNVTALPSRWGSTAVLTRRTTVEVGNEPIRPNGHDGPSAQPGARHRPRSQHLACRPLTTPLLNTA
jgi:hypothetical protein